MIEVIMKFGRHKDIGGTYTSVGKYLYLYFCKHKQVIFDCSKTPHDNSRWMVHPCSKVIGIFSAMSKSGT